MSKFPIIRFSLMSQWSVPLLRCDKIRTGYIADATAKI
jgi:hypothetical protein